MSGSTGIEQRLLRPFDRLSTSQALAFGLVAIVATALLADQTGLQTRGLLDLQFVAGGRTWALVAQGLVNWLCLSLALLIAGRWLSPQPFSPLRLLAFQAAARWPLLLSVIYLSIPPLGRQIRELSQRLLQAMPSEPGQVMADAAYMGDAFILTLLGVPLLVFLVWMVWLMFHGYQSVTKLRGASAGLSFTGALAAAWILSKALMLLVR